MIIIPHNITIKRGHFTCFIMSAKQKTCVTQDESWISRTQKLNSPSSKKRVNAKQVGGTWLVFCPSQDSLENDLIKCN